MLPSIHRHKAEEMTDVAIILTEDLFPSDVINVDFQKETNFETSVSSDVERLFTALIPRRKEQSEHEQLDETTDTRERSHIWTLEDEDHAEVDADKSENLIDHFERITYRNGVLSMSYKVLMKVLSLPLVLFRSPWPVIYKPSRTYNRVIAKLIHMEDNGNFDEFDSYSSAVLKRYEDIDPDIVAAVAVEQARCYTYRKNVGLARIHAKRGLELARHTSFPTMFEGRAFKMMATICRNQKKLGAMEKNLELAEQSFKGGWDLEDMANFHECQGSYQDSLMGRLAQPDESVKQRALDSFKKMGEVALQDSRPRVRDKNRFYALIKSARILLDSNSPFGRRKRTVSRDSIALASRYLEVIKKELWKNIPRGSQVQFRLVESDLYFRQGKFEEERDLLLQCLDEARSYGFKTQVPIILQRLKEVEEIQAKIPYYAEMDDPVKNIHHEVSSDSDKESANENSSGTSSDVFSSNDL